MKQSINLYISLETKSATALNAKRVVEISLLTIILLAFVYAATWWKTADKHSELESLNKQQAELKTDLEKIKAKEAVDKSSVELQSKLNTLIARRDAKLKVLGVLSNGNLGNLKGLSNYMRALSDQMVEGVWLRHFEITEGGNSLLIEGSATDSSAVPELIQQLGKSEAFAGRTFSNFTLRQNEKDTSIVDFTINSGGTGSGAADKNAPQQNQEASK